MACFVQGRGQINQPKPNKTPRSLLAKRMTLYYQSKKEQESVRKENTNFSQICLVNFWTSIVLEK